MKKTYITVRLGKVSDNKIYTGGWFCYYINVGDLYFDVRDILWMLVNIVGVRVKCVKKWIDQVGGLRKCPQFGQKGRHHLKVVNKHLAYYIGQKHWFRYNCYLFFKCTLFQIRFQ